MDDQERIVTPEMLDLRAPEDLPLDEKAVDAHYKDTLSNLTRTMGLPDGTKLYAVANGKDAYRADPKTLEGEPGELVGGTTAKKKGRLTYCLLLRFADGEIHPLDSTTPCYNFGATPPKYWPRHIVEKDPVTGEETERTERPSDKRHWFYLITERYIRMRYTVVC